MVADIRFDEVAGGSETGGSESGREASGWADITVDDEEAGAFASWSSVYGRLTRVKVNVARDWLADYGTTLDSFSFSTYVHEFGHALGLGHMGHYNGSARFPRDARFLNDSHQVSVMSYFSQGENSAVIADHAEPVTAMLADIVAVQRLHGTPDAASPTAGDTVWGGTGTSTGTYLDALLGGPGDDTLYGGAGHDRMGPTI